MLSMINPDQLQNSKMANQGGQHMSQNIPVTGQQEKFYDPNSTGDMGGRT